MDAYFGAGVSQQLAAFREGFEEVFPLRTLSIFSPEEIEELVCGCGAEDWTVETLTQAIKCDHGYTIASAPVQNFLHLLSNLNHKQRTLFLKFVTGSPRLPPGGLGSLKPPLTIVRRGGEEGDQALLSVMTCANYIKLPPYTTREAMEKKLVFAINEGQGSFDLS